MGFMAATGLEETRCSTVSSLVVCQGVRPPVTSPRKTSSTSSPSKQAQRQQRSCEELSSQVLRVLVGRVRLESLARRIFDRSSLRERLYQLEARLLLDQFKPERS